MRKLSLFVMFVVFFVFAGCASATSYYISYSSGSNTNSGTSKSSPWKTHPYMQTGAACTGTGSAPSYSHSAGDQFIFMQGDSWPNSCFDMVIQSGGASGNPDVYTFDPTWGTSRGTTGNLGQAVGTYQFNGGNSAMGSDGWNSFISDYGNFGNITFNGMEMTNYVFASGSYGVNHMIELYQSQNVVVSNIWAHGWLHGSSGSDNMHVVSGYNTYNTNAGSRLTGSVIDGVSDGGVSGEGAYAIPIIDNNIVKNASNGFVSQEDSNIHDNQIGPINQSFDSSDHENCIEPDGPYAGVTTHSYIYNNVFHDCTAVGLLAAGNNSNSGSSVYYVWNNVVYQGVISSGNQRILLQFSAVGNGGGNEAHVWNNTINGDSQYCVRTLSQGGSWSVLDVQNNHCISNQGVLLNNSSGGSQTNNNNLLMSVATAASQGYTSSETYAYSPTSATAGTVGAGANLTSLASGIAAALVTDTTTGGVRVSKSRPTSGAWDVGAYQFGSSGSKSSGAPTPPTNVKVLAVQ